MRRLKPATEEIKASNLYTLYPTIRLQTNIPALTAQVTMVTLSLLNSLWAGTARPVDRHSIAHCVIVDMIAVAPRHALVQAVCHHAGLQKGLQALMGTRPTDVVAVDRLVRTAAGALTAGYALGLQARAGASELGVKDDCAVYWCRLEGMFTNMPANGMRVGIPAALKTCLKRLGAWDAFRKLCLSAFHALRKEIDRVLVVVLPLLHRCGIEEARVQEFLRGKGSLNLAHGHGLGHSYRADFHFRRWLGR